jgi:hypothetical protein
VEEVIEEENIDSNENIETIWSALTKWVIYLANNKKYIKYPIEVEQWINDLSKNDDEKQTLRSLYLQNIYMIYWFFISYHKLPEQNPDSFCKAVLFYFWDEWLSMSEQKSLAYTAFDEDDVTDLTQECIEENAYVIGKTVIHRFFNPTTSDIDYITAIPNGFKVADAVFIDSIIDDTDENIKAFRPAPRTTGDTYGFIVSKNQSLVFKTAIPPGVGEPLPRGKECANVSTMTGHINDLIHLGDILEDNGYGDFDLTVNVIVKQRKIANSNRACTVMDLTLRYMDAEAISGKRWFFRPVQSYYIGHKGFNRRSIK